MDLSYFQEHADAVIQAWYPGARGGQVIARILFGDISPSGKLPVTFYNSADELPAFEDYSMKGRTYRYFTGSPLYPFGYGLTYGDVSVESVECNGVLFRNAASGKGNSPEAVVIPQNDIRIPEAVSVTVTVTNRSSVATDDVIQIYVKALDTPYAPPNPRLCAFSRIRLGGGESRKVTMLIPGDAFTMISDTGEKITDSRRFLLSAGLGQPDERTCELTGKENISFLLEGAENF